MQNTVEPLYTCGTIKRNSRCGARRTHTQALSKQLTGHEMALAAVHRLDRVIPMAERAHGLVVEKLRHRLLRRLRRALLALLLEDMDPCPKVLTFREVGGGGRGDGRPLERDELLGDARGRRLRVQSERAHVREEEGEQEQAKHDWTGLRVGGRALRRRQSRDEIAGAF